MHLQKHLQQAVAIINAYKGEMPFAAHLKNYFAQHKKHGSTDRKNITAFCYAYFRLGTSLPADFDRSERIRIGIFLSELSLKFSALLEDFGETIQADLETRIQFASEKYPSFKPQHIFPLSDQLSTEINSLNFGRSHLIQPDLFLRTRPGKQEIVQQKLNTANTIYTIEENAVRLPSNTKAEQLFTINKDVVVQDLSSQKVSELLKKILITKSPFSVWDCCAASGGKSILALDVFKQNHQITKSTNHQISLTVSDVRSSILHNLQKRFSQAGITHYRSFVADMTMPLNNSSEIFDLIICDAPCTGSGTWGRTPEQLVLFEKDKIGYYTTLQRSIVTNSVKQLAEQGYFLYITCSVFDTENEKMAAYISDELKLKRIESRYFKGYDERADTLFAALFTV